MTNTHLKELLLQNPQQAELILRTWLAIMDDLKINVSDMLKYLFALDNFDDKVDEALYFMIQQLQQDGSRWYK